MPQEKTTGIDRLLNQRRPGYSLSIKYCIQTRLWIHEPELFKKTAAPCLLGPRGRVPGLIAAIHWWERRIL